MGSVHNISERLSDVVEGLILNFPIIALLRRMQSKVLVLASYTAVSRQFASHTFKQRISVTSVLLVLFTPDAKH